MNRTFKDYALLTLKGIGMGAADVVPGVSGGTIAFIVGIYEELIDSIKSINLTSLKMLCSLKFSRFWKAVNGNFLLAILSGLVFLFRVGAGVDLVCFAGGRSMECKNGDRICSGRRSSICNNHHYTCRNFK